MKMIDFRRMLADAQRLYAAAGAQVPAKDMAALSEALEPLDDQDVDTALKLIGDGINKPDGVKVTAKQHLAMLQAAGADEAQFESIMKLLEANRAIKATDLDEIGTAYTNSPQFAKLYKTRPAKLKRLRQAFQDKCEFESRGKVIDDLVPWQ